MSDPTRFPGPGLPGKNPEHTPLDTPTKRHDIDRDVPGSDKPWRDKTDTQRLPGKGDDRNDQKRD